MIPLLIDVDALVTAVHWRRNHDGLWVKYPTGLRVADIPSSYGRQQVEQLEVGDVVTDRKQHKGDPCFRVVVSCGAVVERDAWRYVMEGCEPPATRVWPVPRPMTVPDGHLEVVGLRQFDRLASDYQGQYPNPGDLLIFIGDEHRFATFGKLPWWMVYHAVGEGRFVVGKIT